MHLIRPLILLSMLATVGCDAQEYQSYFGSYNVRPYAEQFYTLQPATPGNPLYQEPRYAVPGYVTPPFAYDDSFVSRRDGYYGSPDDFHRRTGERREREFRQEQGFQQRETQQRQELYNSHVRDLQTQHNQGVVGLQQQFNQGRINRDQLNNGYRQLEQNMNGAIANEQRALPR